MKRKQRLAMLLIGCMCASILLSGCNNDLSDKLNNKYESSESPPETQYTITFDANGGTCMVTELTVNQNTTIGNLPTPERENHTFDGWYDAPENGNIVTNATIVNNNMTLYAYWTANEQQPDDTHYTVTLDANGGTCNTDSLQIEKDCAIGYIPDPIRDEHSFNGWFTEREGGDQVTPETVVTSNCTYYAQWTYIEKPPVQPDEPTYKVSFNANNGNCSTESIDVQNNQPYASLPNATRTGFNFDGWYTLAVGGNKINNDTTVNLQSDQTLYAHWTHKTYSINYDMNGASNTISKLTKKHGVKVYLSNVVPTKDNYKFENWLNTETNETYNPGQSVNFNKNTTLKAQYSKCNQADIPTFSYCTVTFDPNNGSIVYGSNKSKIVKDNKVGTLPIPLRSGYIFLGWYDGDNMITKDNTFDGNKTVTAKWKRTPDTELNNYINMNYVKSILHDELVNTIVNDEGDNITYEKDEVIKEHIRNTGINQGWRCSTHFDPDYFSRQMLKTYGIKFDKYKDAWECALGFIGHRGIEEYNKMIKGTCQHDGGTISDEKTCKFDNFVRAVTEEKVIGTQLTCSCGFIFNNSDEHTLHCDELMEQGLEPCGVSSTEIYETIVKEPAYIEHEYRTYCMNTGQVKNTKTEREPWTGPGSGMP